MKLDNKTFDILAFIQRKVLPALGTLYFVLVKLWGLPYGVEIVGTIAAVDAFMGELLGISTEKYKREQELYINLKDKD